VVKAAGIDKRATDSMLQRASLLVADRRTCNRRRVDCLPSLLQQRRWTHTAFGQTDRHTSVQTTKLTASYNRPTNRNLVHSEVKHTPSYILERHLFRYSTQKCMLNRRVELQCNAGLSLTAQPTLITWPTAHTLLPSALDTDVRSGTAGAMNTKLGRL
jgi:hypothetical protein